jgi:hypothetical protein
MRKQIPASLYAGGESLAIDLRRASLLLAIHAVIYTEREFATKKAKRFF